MASSETCSLDSQSEEIASLKKVFTTCKVITDVGDFHHVVDVSGENLDLIIKFQLENAYPSIAPNIIVKSQHLSTEDKLALTEHLQTKALEFLGEIMMEKLYNIAKEWIFENGFQVTPGKVKSKVKTNVKKTKKIGKSINNSDNINKPSKKLASMKTATDVVSRIIWDDQISMEDFSVGYLDRFVGIVERDFSTFTWEDLASVDYDALAIPKHRIHYFKYKELKVWDKDQRMDNVFGSTGSGLTITDVIEKYEAGDMDVPSETHKSCDQEGSASEDEDIVIKTGLDENDTEEGVMYPRDKYWGPKKRPTHFVCLRITDPDICKEVASIRSTILEVESSYEENVMPEDRLHITLCCLGLDTQEDINKATEILHKVKPELDSLHPNNIDVELSGVDNFFHNVLYAKVKHNEHFLEFVRTLTLGLQEAGLEIRDVFKFTPHMTLLKFKKSLQKEMKTRYLDPRLYEQLGTKYFGKQNVNNLYLCEMSENRDEVGFYICPTQIKF